MKKVLLALLMAVLLEPALLHAAKPRSPLQVAISPVQSGLVAANIKPGDVVEFKIIGKTFADADELNINVELHGGVALVSGEISWTGPASKGEDKTLLITVRAPKHGNGWIKARISLPPTSGASFAAGATGSRSACTSAWRTSKSRSRARRASLLRREPSAPT